MGEFNTIAMKMLLITRISLQAISRCQQHTIIIILIRVKEKKCLTVQESFDFVGGGLFEWLYLMDHRL